MSYPQPTERSIELEGWTFRPANINNTRHWYVYLGIDRSHPFAIITENEDRTYCVKGLCFKSMPTLTWDQAVRLILDHL